MKTFQFGDVLSVVVGRVLSLGGYDAVKALVDYVDAPFDGVGERKACAAFLKEQFSCLACPEIDRAIADFNTVLEITERTPSSRHTAVAYLNTLLINGLYGRSFPATLRVKAFPRRRETSKSRR
jgi:hypothetical protein